MASRVFLGLTEVAGYFSGLESGLRALGVEAQLYDLSANVSGYRQASPNASGRIRRSLLRLSAAPPGTSKRFVWDRLLWLNRSVRTLRAVLLLPFAVLRYDTFILSGAGLFLEGRELALLHRLGKRVVVVFTGSDHRPPYLNGIWIRDAQVAGYRGLIQDTKAIQARVLRAERHATAIVALPASAQFHRRPFADFLKIGIPFAVLPEAPAQVTTPVASDVVRVLHAPTRPVEKGSDRIRAAISDLQSKGHRIEYRELTRQPHSAVLEAINWCDFVVDEVFSDTPMAGFATEAAFYGRPAVVSGYLAGDPPWTADASHVPPTLFVTPDRLEDAIERLVVDAAFREDLGSRARAFVHENWSASSVAARVMALAAGDAPLDWMVDPATISYVNGWGLSEELLQTGVRGLLHAAGPSALGLDGRPDLRERLVALAGRERPPDAVSKSSPKSSMATR